MAASETEPLVSFRRRAASMLQIYHFHANGLRFAASRFNIRRNECQHSRAHIVYVCISENCGVIDFQDIGQMKDTRAPEHTMARTLTTVGDEKIITSHYDYSA